ncbi:hypothetical protein WL88_24435 [Burkholderia diffusa]|uniref:Uncharacterized protein n=1 Tax=Burkholderia diffusa TaxID=488732 RepID=A0AAW3P8Q5_9BURK|nr:hypothetical protein WL86_28445 [Burkholderia diffusa]KWF43502.1 hypothetical protein WL87_06060 [Burkholderia diffusa]KWF46492.1 hypothetical protein WL88_24435 [Burkholderia diffusa]
MERDAMIAPNAGAPKRHRTRSRARAFASPASFACGAPAASIEHRRPSSARYVPFNFDSYRM